MLNNSHRTLLTQLWYVRIHSWWRCLSVSHPWGESWMDYVFQDARPKLWHHPQLLTEVCDDILEPYICLYQNYILLFSPVYGSSALGSGLACILCDLESMIKAPPISCSFSDILSPVKVPLKQTNVKFCYFPFWKFPLTWNPWRKIPRILWKLTFLLWKIVSKMRKTVGLGEHRRGVTARSRVGSWKIFSNSYDHRYEKLLRSLFYSGSGLSFSISSRRWEFN